MARDRLVSVRTPHYRPENPIASGMQIERFHSAALPSDLRRDIIALCNLAYEEDLSHYFDDVGPGLHLVGRNDAEVVSHALIVPRSLETPGLAPLHTGYVELVATHPAAQGRGNASALLRRAADALVEFDIGALSPSDEAFYRRLGWELWRGPLSVRTEAGLEATPDEEVMILRLPRTPASLSLDAPLSIEWRPGEVW